MDPARPLRGSRQHDIFPPGPTPPLKSLDSAFQLQEYISLLIREDPHDIERIVSLPKPTRSKNEGQESTEDEGENVDENCWIYEHLRRLAQDLNHPLITTLQLECTRETCPEMKAGEWLYLCVAHGTNNNAMEQCCAIDYVLHTVDSATALLNSPRAFPSRIAIPPSSHRHFISLARRLGRIFAHAYFQHREAFEEAEAESSLYSRYLALTSKFELVPADYLNIPTRSSHHSDLETSIEISRGPLSAIPYPQGSPNKGTRNRTDTMILSEGFSLPREEDIEMYQAEVDNMERDLERGDEVEGGEDDQHTHEPSSIYEGDSDEVPDPHMDIESEAPIVSKAIVDNIPEDEPEPELEPVDSEDSKHADEAVIKESENDEPDPEPVSEQAQSEEPSEPQAEPVLEKDFALETSNSSKTVEDEPPVVIEAPQAEEAEDVAEGKEEKDVEALEEAAAPAHKEATPEDEPEEVAAPAPKESTPDEHEEAKELAHKEVVAEEDRDEVDVADEVEEKEPVSQPVPADEMREKSPEI